MKTILLICLTLSLAHSQTPSDASDSNSADKYSPTEAFDYPELQVVPRASERVMQEALAEKEDNFTTDWPIILPSVLTLLNGSQLGNKNRPGADREEKDQMQWAATSASLISGGTLAEIF